MPYMEHLKPASTPKGTELVLLDALGTILELEPPWEHLAAVLDEPVTDRLVGAVRAEMSYYKAHSHEGRDPRSLVELRERCAGILTAELSREVDVATMMGSIRFRAYPDALPALDALRALGLRLICVSNWDCSLPDVLERCGIRSRLDAVVTSAEARARKPDPAIFGVALELAGVEASAALHIGDTLEEDIAGAQTAGIAALLLDRDGDGDIASLAEIASRLDTMPG